MLQQRTESVLCLLTRQGQGETGLCLVFPKHRLVFTESKRNPVSWLLSRSLPVPSDKGVMGKVQGGKKEYYQDSQMILTCMEKTLRKKTRERLLETFYERCKAEE